MAKKAKLKTTKPTVRKTWTWGMTALLVVLVALFTYYHYFIDKDLATDQPNEVLGTQTERGVAYDWQNGAVLNDYQVVDNMPGIWDFISFSSKLENGADSTFGFWAKYADPEIGSRDLQAGDTGDDVLALQTAMNSIRTELVNDPYYFPKLEQTGTIDDQTTKAVKILQGYFSLEQTGSADLNFQSSLYGQIMNAESN